MNEGRKQRRKVGMKKGRKKNGNLEKEEYCKNTQNLYFLLCYFVVTSFIYRGMSSRKRFTVTR